MKRRRYALFSIAAIAFFAALMLRDLVLIYRFGEYEPKFGPMFNVVTAAVLNVVIAAGAAVCVVLLGVSARISKLLPVILVAATLGGILFFVRSERGKYWHARRAVRYVYWRNFHARNPLPNIRAFETPRVQMLLNGFTQLRRDPWRNPFNYELISDVMADHPHRKNWDIEWAFWSNGPDGEDDGHDKRNDVDITNAGL